MATERQAITVDCGLEEGLYDWIIARAKGEHRKPAQWLRVKLIEIRAAEGKADSDGNHKH